MKNTFVLFFEDKNPVIGLKIDEKKDKILVQFKNNKTKQISSNKVITDFELNGNDIEYAGELLFKIADNADISTLYEILEQGKEYSIEDLSNLLYNEKNPINNAATYIALKKDNLFFKEKNHHFVLAKKEDVEVKLRQQEKKQKSCEEKLRIKSLAVKWLCENYFDIPDNIPDYVYTFVEPVKNYAIYGDDYKNIEDAKEILKHLKQRITNSNLKIDFTGAFDLCNRLKIFDIHENLAIHRFNIIRSFKENEILEAKKFYYKDFEKDKDREDLTALETYSIDDETTKDIDDAFSFIKNENGCTVYVHIADVAFYIDIDSELDKRASNLGMSVYLASGKISMFPTILSEDKMSLIAGEKKASLTFITKFDNDFNVIDKSITKSIIKLKQNISYTEADNIINSNANPIFRELYQLSEVLRKKRYEKGAIEFLNPDFKVSVDRDSESISIKKIDVNSKSSQIVKELMLLTGYQAATYCLVNSIPCVYISQDEPLEAIVCESRLIENIVEILNTIKKLNKSNLMIMAYKHYALGLDCYTQCTSPIRRYHDLIIQRQIKSHLAGDRVPYSKEEIQKLSATSEYFKQNLSIAEKEEKTYWILYYLKKHIDEPLKATVISQNKNEYKIYLNDYGLQNKINLYNKLHIGDQIIVKIKNVNPRSGLLTLAFDSKL